MSTTHTHTRRPLSLKRQRKVLEYIEDHITEPIRLSDLADATAMSRYHFGRAFKRTIGMSPLRFVLLQRVAHAKLLLADLDAPLSRVAFECGFASASHFASSFKAITGQTPTAYQASLNS